MKITFANGNELFPIMVTGASRHVEGQNRDTLSFVFPGTKGLDALDKAFTAEACESIKITGDDGSEAIHKNYTIRAELKKALVVVEPATTETEAVTEERITVSMSQRTYAENQLAALATESTDAQLAIAELAELVMGGE